MLTRDSIIRNIKQVRDGVFGITWANLSRQVRHGSIEGEALTLLEAMKDIASRGINHVNFETDSKRVADALQRPHMEASKFSAIICNVQNMLSLNSNFEVKFIKRQTNIVTHKLAKVTTSWTSCYHFELILLILKLF
jgi:hypothetical protein